MFHVFRALWQTFNKYKCDNVLMLIQMTLLIQLFILRLKQSVCIECILSAVKHVILLLFWDLPLVHLRLYWVNPVKVIFRIQKFLRSVYRVIINIIKPHYCWNKRNDYIITRMFSYEYESPAQHAFRNAQHWLSEWIKAALILSSALKRHFEQQCPVANELF